MHFATVAIVPNFCDYLGICSSLDLKQQVSVTMNYRLLLPVPLKSNLNLAGLSSMHFKDLIPNRSLLFSVLVVRF